LIENSRKGLGAQGGVATLRRPIKKLWKGSEMQALAFFKIPRCLNDNNWNTFGPTIQLEHHELCGENSGRFLPKGIYCTAMFLAHGKQLRNVEMRHARRICFSSAFTLFTLHCYRIRVGLGIP